MDAKRGQEADRVADNNNTYTGANGIHANYGDHIRGVQFAAVQVPLGSLGTTKANPGKLNYGHLGIGSSQNLVAKRLEKVTGMSMTGIPYKGAADALHEVASGRLDLFVGPPFAVMPLYEGKQVKVLAVTGKERLASAPDVPTLTESGIPIVTYAWLGICAGAGTPQPIINLLNSEITPILKSDDYRALLATSASVPMSSTPQEMQDVIDDTVKQAAPLVDEFNLHLN